MNFLKANLLVFQFFYVTLVASLKAYYVCIERSLHRAKWNTTYSQLALEPSGGTTMNFFKANLLVFQFFYVTLVASLKDVHIAQLLKSEGGSLSRVRLRQIVHCAVLCLSGNTSCQVFGVKSVVDLCKECDRWSKQLNSDHDQLQINHVKKTSDGKLMISLI